MQQTFSNFDSNLKLACSTRKSISDLCRTIGVNRQQFNRYLNAGTAPSPHNRLRIAAAFGLDPIDFDLPPLAFWRKLNEREHPQPKEGPLVNAYPGDLLALRPYLGFYQTWHVSPSWPDRIICSCAHLQEKDGQVHVSSLDRIMDHESGIAQRSRYDGLVAYRHQRLFLTELTRADVPTFGQTILMPFETYQRRYLRGLTMGLSWRNNHLPYATRTMWRHLGKVTNKRRLVLNCGSYKPGSAAVPSAVVSFLTESEPLTATDR